ncbi:hypothetical protein JA33_242 [Dickeya phage vB_DsoM_JA33]|uniref:Uncharacterized protein n=2 Tax=Salmondvirus JA11 TaxID=2734141 RepID=A0A386K5W6_9CAUD|nr:hypothetical protein HOU32_gp241 [Dickeya phage vB_DsoM_JA11]AXG67616.1 hypothetical protein JA33_242 [Dickeya phage vB_DsoM_JA33]AYD80046.1 hypothetical protein JA11_241 [Dickeya phage vB_DsoM_JA11]
MADYTKEVLEQMNIAQLTDIADEFRLYEDMHDDDDAPDQSEMIEDILAEQERLNRANEYSLNRLKNSILTRD